MLDLGQMTSSDDGHLLPGNFRFPAFAPAGEGAINLHCFNSLSCCVSTGTHFEGNAVIVLSKVKAKQPGSEERTSTH